VAACCGIVALAAFFLLRGKPSVPTQPKDEPVAVANPTATPAAPAETAAPMPTEFVFAQGFLPPTAVVKVNDQVVNTKKDGSRVVVPLTGIANGASLYLEARGYETEFFPILHAGTTVDQRVELRRKQGAVVVQLRGNATDYATAELRPLKALPGEEAYVRMEQDNHNIDLASAAKTSVPTGIYQVTLAGAGDGAHIDPRVVDTRFSVSGDQQNILQIPPSFRGRYTFEFLFRQDVNLPPVKVRRTIVIDPGLTTGHVDDLYFADKSVNATPARDTLITDLVLNAQGVLHGRIRFSLRKDENMAYDEQFELSFTDNQFVIVSGGWEVPPSDPAIARMIAAHLAKGYEIHLSRPNPQTVIKE
jgi:hypothetical protein